MSTRTLSFTEVRKTPGLWELADLCQSRSDWKVLPGFLDRVVCMQPLIHAASLQLPGNFGLQVVHTQSGLPVANTTFDLVKVEDLFGPELTIMHIRHMPAAAYRNTLTREARLLQEIHDLKDILLKSLVEIGCDYKLYSLITEAAHIVNQGSSSLMKVLLEQADKWALTHGFNYNAKETWLEYHLNTG